MTAVFNSGRLILGCFFFLLNANIHAQTAADILNHYLDAVSYGDVSKWENVKTFYATSTGYFNAEKMGYDSPTLDNDKTSYKKTYKAWPDKMKEELYSDSLYVNLNSEFYYFKNKRIIMLANIPPMEVAGDNSLWFDFLPIIVKNYFNNGKSISYNGIKEIQGIPSPQHEIEIQTKEEIRRLLFNTETFLLEAIYFPEANTYWIYSKYKDFDGYLMPTCVTSTNNGNTFSSTNYKTMAFNQSIDMNMFNYK